MYKKTKKALLEGDWDIQKLTKKAMTTTKLKKRKVKPYAVTIPFERIQFECIKCGARYMGGEKHKCEKPKRKSSAGRK